MLGMIIDKTPPSLELAFCIFYAFLRKFLAQKRISPISPGGIQKQTPHNRAQNGHRHIVSHAVPGISDGENHNKQVIPFRKTKERRIAKSDQHYSGTAKFRGSRL